jgi:hypothetical protein
VDDKDERRMDRMNKKARPASGREEEGRRRDASRLFLGRFF